MTDLSRLYQTDYAAWARRNAELLRAGRYAELDVEHLLEELSDMGKSERRELEDARELRRLRWQCRRGMLELDHLLIRFLDRGYPDLDVAGRQTFLRLLGEQDQCLSDWFMSRAPAPDQAMRDLVDRILEVASEPPRASCGPGVWPPGVPVSDR